MIDLDAIARAVAILARGGLVAFPTETVYGLAADARNQAAVARLFEVKGRPLTQALTVHLGPQADPGRWGVLDDRARRLAAAFWPGPLTLIVPRQPEVGDFITGGQDNVGLRVPDHPVAIALLDAFGDGVVAPSANRWGEPPPTTAAAVHAALGDAPGMVLDGGPCRLGVSSTVLTLAGEHPRILRKGSIGVEELQSLLGEPVDHG